MLGSWLVPSIFVLLRVIILLLESALCSEFSCYVNAALFLLNMYFGCEHTS